MRNRNFKLTTLTEMQVTESNKKRTLKATTIIDNNDFFYF